MEDLFGKYIFCASSICSTIYCYGNNVAMATDKCLSDCVTRWATKLFLTESCAEIIASGASCYIMVCTVCTIRVCIVYVLWFDCLYVCSFYLFDKL